MSRTIGSLPSVTVVMDSRGTKPRIRWRVPRSIPAALIVLSALLCVPALMGTGSTRLAIIGGALSAAMAAVYGLFAYAGYSRRPGRDLWLTAPGLFWLVTSVTLGLASIGWIRTDTASIGAEASDVARSLPLAALWLWATVVGFFATTPRLRFRSPLERFNGMAERFPGSGVAAFGVGLAATVALVNLGRFGFVSGTEAAQTTTSSLAQLVYSLTFGMTFGSVIVLWKGLTTPSGRLQVLGTVMFTFTGGIGLVSGNKEPVLAAAFAFAATWYLARGRIPRIFLVGAVMLAIAVFAFVSPYRENVRGRDLPPSDAIAATLSSLTTDVDAAELVTANIESLSARVRSIDSLALITSRTPGEIPYRDPLFLPRDIAAAVIPRSLWPEKPILSDGKDFAIEYAGYRSDTKTAIAVTLPGDAYRYGGGLAIALFGLLLGGYLAILDRLMDPSARPAALILFLPLALGIAQSENGIALTVAGQIQLAVIAYLWMWFLLARDHHHAPRPPTGLADTTSRNR
jgi:hypothetical protein